MCYQVGRVVYCGSYGVSKKGLKCSRHASIVNSEAGCDFGRQAELETTQGLLLNVLSCWQVVLEIVALSAAFFTLLHRQTESWNSFRLSLLDAFCFC